MCDLIIVGVVGELVEVDVVGFLGEEGLQVINLAQDTSYYGFQMDTEYGLNIMQEVKEAHASCVRLAKKETGLFL